MRMLRTQSMLAAPPARRRQLLSVCCSAALCAAAPLGTSATEARLHAAPAATGARVVVPLVSARSRGDAFDVVRQDLVVSNFAWIESPDPAALEQEVKAAVTGTVQVVVVARGAGLAELPFAFHGLVVQRAVDQQGRALAFTDGAVRLAQQAGIGDTLRVTLSYSGEVAGDGNAIYPLGQTGAQWRRAYWMMLGSGWDLGPSLSVVSDSEPRPLRGSVTITMPAEYQLVTNQELVFDSARADGRHTLKWNDDGPTAPTPGFSTAIGRWAYVSDIWTRPDGRRVPISVYFPPELREGGQATLQVLMRAMDVYERSGNPYPYGTYRQVMSARMEYPRGWRGTSGDGFGIVTGLAHPSRYPSVGHAELHGYVHELAHNLIFGPHEPQADFMWTQYEAAVGGPWAEQQAVGLMSDSAPNPDDSYAVGRMFYYLLKRHLGDEQFRAVMRTYVTKYSSGYSDYRPGLTEGFLKALQETTGQDLTWFVDQWYFINQPATWPEFVVTAQYDAAAQRVTLQVEQTQKNDEGEAPTVLQMPVTVRVATPQGDVLTTARLTARKQTVVVEQVRAAPTTIIFDDKDAISKRLTFEQPIAWLIEQLKRESTAWQTWWTIRQLGSRAGSGDTTAKAALVAAIEQGKHSLTRQWAVEVLGGAALHIPLPVLRRAVQDSSAQVREAAIGMLVSLPAAEALPLLMQVFETEPTPFLRAASVFFALQLQDWTDQAAKLALLQRALATPTGDEELRVRTLDMIRDGEMCDDALVSSVEQLLGQHVVAVETAYKLSGKCPAFKAMLERHRKDDRPQVRRWIAQVYAGSGSD